MVKHTICFFFFKIFIESKTIILWRCFFQHKVKYKKNYEFEQTFSKIVAMYLSLAHNKQFYKMKELKIFKQNSRILFCKEI